jgi:hypothetical protein
LARNAELLEQLELGRLDLALAWDGGKLTAHTQPIGKLAMCWIGARQLGVTVRTRAGLPGSVKVLKTLPRLPQIGLNLHRAEAEGFTAVRRLEELLLTQLEIVAPQLRLRTGRRSRPIAA